MNNKKKLHAITLFALLGIFMISSPSLRIYAADEQGSSGGDSGGDSGSSDGGDEQGSSGGSEDNNQESNDGGGSKDSGSQEEEDKPEVNDEPKQEDKPVNDIPPVVPIEPIIKEKPYKGTAPDEVCDVSHECVGPGVTPGGAKGCHGLYCAGDIPKTPIKKEPWNCKNKFDACDKRFPIHPNPYKGKPPIQKYCTSKWDKDCKPDNGNWCKQHPGKCGSGKDGKHDHDGNDRNCHNWWSNWSCHHRHHDNDNDHHNHRDSQHTHTSTSGSHEDLTVIVNIDHYNTKSPSKLDDFKLRFDIAEGDGDNVYDKDIDLSDMPDKVKVTGLDIDEGDAFLVTLANMKAEDGDSYLAVSTDNDEDLDVFLTAE